jgi:anti-sigma factor RsiW
MSKQSKLTDEDRANLVAYLDGELDAKSARALEAKLQLDPTARAEAETLRRTWELLDALPRREASGEFTHKTVERMEALRPSRTTPARTHRRWLAVASWAAGILLAVGLGFTGARLLGPPGGPPIPEPAELEQQLVRDLRLIENKRLYDVVDDLDFLRALAEPDLFGEDS